jgi:carboxylesterase
VIDRDALVAALDAAEAHLLDREMCTTIYDHGARTARVVVLLHGLTASPRTWRDFALARHARGESVLVPRLPRHGHADRRTTALAALSAGELREAAERIVDAARVLGDEIVLVGHSLGGALALHVAHDDPRVFRAIAIAPFLGIRPLPHGWQRTLRRVFERAPNAFLYWDPIRRGRDEPGHGYPRYTTRALAAGLSLAEALQHEAVVRGPRAAHVEIVRNEREASVNNAAIDALVARWRGAGAPRVRLHRLVGLGLSHDVIEPERPSAPALRFLPHLHALLDAGPPNEDLVIDAR